MKLYRYIYFRTYMWNYYLWKNKEMAAFNSTLAITFDIVMSILLIKIFIEKSFNLSLSSPFDNLYTSLGFGFLILAAHYYLFEHNKKYLEIEAEFIEGKKNKKQWLIRGFLTFTYVVGIILGLFLV